MSHRFLAALFTVTAVVLLVPLTAAAQSGASSTLPRTPWGDPDLQGVWTNHHGVPLERPNALAGKAELTNQELAALEAEAIQNRDRAIPGQVGSYNSFWVERGERAFSKRPSLIVDPPDGRLPLRPDVKKILDARVAAKRSPTYASSSWEDRDAYERCITRGMPGAMIPGFYNHNYQILQTPGYVVIHVEMIHDARIIPVDGRPSLPPRLGQWMGASRGRWEGNTLVVDVTNLKAQTWFDHMGNFYSDAAHIVERWTMIAADAIHYEGTIVDPKVYTRPWTISFGIRRNSDPGYELMEVACHEGSRGQFTDVGLKFYPGVTPLK